MRTHLSDARNRSRFVPREDVGQVARWEFDALSGRQDPHQVIEALRIQHAQELACAIEQARAEGEACGFSRGQADAQRQMSEFLSETGCPLAEMVTTVSQALRVELDDIRHQAALSVATLMVTLVRQVLRTRVAHDPEMLAQVVREALADLSGQSGRTRVCLHPQDLQMLRQHGLSAVSSAEMDWVEDPELARGDCRLVASHGDIDATVAARWKDAMHALGLDVPWTEAREEAVRA